MDWYQCDWNLSPLGLKGQHAQFKQSQTNQTSHMSLCNVCVRAMPDVYHGNCAKLPYSMCRHVHSQKDFMHVPHCSNPQTHVTVDLLLLLKEALVIPKTMRMVICCMRMRMCTGKWHAASSDADVWRKFVTNT